MKRVKILLLICMVMPFFSAMAQNRTKVFDNSRPDKIVTFGVRVGLNSSSISTNFLSANSEMIQNNIYWRMGGQVGGAAYLNITKLLAIQTGLSFENRSFDCALMAADANSDYMGSSFIHSRFNYLHIPFMLTFRLNLMENMEWEFDLGGYYAYGVNGKKKQRNYIAFGEENGDLVFDKSTIRSDYFGLESRDFLAVGHSDLGLKIGTGFTFFKHYYLGVFYERSLKNLAKQNPGAPAYKIKNLNWNVSLGYNF